MFSTAHTLHLDVETRSTLDLKKCGTYVYALHPTTDLWVGCYAFDDEPVQRWFPGQPCPERIADHVRAGGRTLAWNTQFERVIWKCILAPRYGWPEPRLEQWDDPMVWALVMSFPGALDQFAQAMALRVQKDMEGRRLMLRMARPRKVYDNGAVTWWDDPARIERLAQYCATDVETEREATRHLLPLTDDERENWLIDQRINDRGVKVDLPFVAAGKRVVTRRVDKLNARLRVLTGDQVPAATNVNAIGQWLLRQGVSAESLDKDAVIQLLKRDDLSPAIREVLTIRQRVGKSSTAKLDAFENATCVDGRVRGIYQFHKAGPGRWSSTLVQLHNLPRGKKEHQKQFDYLCSAIARGDDDWLEIEFGDPMDAVSSALRGCLIAAHGTVLTPRDFSAIESRVLAWAAGETWKVAAYSAYDAKQGPDIYRLTYARPFRVDPATVDDNQRQIGKVQDLSMGYQGGVGAFVSMAANYQMSIPALTEAAWHTIPNDVMYAATEAYEQRGGGDLTEREWILCESLKILWRESHPATVELWRALEAAAVSAVRYPGQVFSAQSPESSYARADFRYRVVNGHLWCRLPSGRAICYPFPHVRLVPTPWGTDKYQLSYMGLNAVTKQWERQYSYGGHLTENNIQGIGADYQRRAIKILSREHGVPIVGHTHDEVIPEVPEADGPRVLELAGAVMHSRPEWAPGCPIASNGFLTRRYRKE